MSDSERIAALERDNKKLIEFVSNLDILSDVNELMKTLEVKYDE